MSDLPETVFIIDKLNEEFDVLQDKNIELENKMKKFMKKTLITFIKYNEEFIDDGYKIDNEDRKIWNEVLQEMNDNDWNDDDCMNELYIMDLEWTTPQMWICNRMRYCLECEAKPDDVEMVSYCNEYVCIQCKAEIDGQGQNLDIVATLSDTDSESEEEVVE